VVKLLKGETLFGKYDKVQTAIERLRQFEPPEGYYLAFSGGKDSVVIKRLAEMSGVKFDAHYNLTTVDPPELVQFIRREHPEVIWDRPKETMWDLIVSNGIPPLRQVRYCCRILKERGGEGRFTITGIRAAESARRGKRQMVESCPTGGKRFLHPIFDWTDEDVWQFIHENKVPYCSLYDEGFTRLGCVLCPNGGKEQKKQQIERWPKVIDSYRRACNRAYASRVERGMKTDNWTSGDDMFEWWINGSPAQDEDENQQRFFFE
jgi:phosphoadenosine phosphosulfate reductase